MIDLEWVSDYIDIKDENLKNDFADALESQIRGTYSSPNGPAINSLAQALNSNDIFKNTFIRLWKNKRRKIS